MFLVLPSLPFALKTSRATSFFFKKVILAPRCQSYPGRLYLSAIYNRSVSTAKPDARHLLSRRVLIPSPLNSTPNTFANWYTMHTEPPYEYSFLIFYPIPATRERRGRDNHHKVLFRRAFVFFAGLPIARRTTRF